LRPYASMRANATCQLVGAGSECGMEVCEFIG